MAQLPDLQQELVMDAKDNRFYRELPSTERHVLIDYTNHAGVRQLRQIVPTPDGMRFDSSQWHPEKQWLLNAYDVGKDDLRTFAVSSIHGWQPAYSRAARADVSLAKQLQASIERNGRMVRRLNEAAVRLGKEADPAMRDLGTDLCAIARDEDPA